MKDREAIPETDRGVLRMRLSLVPVVLAVVAPLAGCGLLLDTSPPDQDPDGGGMCDGPEDCDDTLACTVDSCSAEGVCEHAADDTLCDGDDICVPSVGCVRPCDDPADCADLNAGTCATGQCTFVTDGVGYCTQHLDHASCADEHACTVDTCDSSGQCSSVASNEACDDGLDCTHDACEPLNGEHDEDGCVHRPDDQECADDFDCTLDLCLPGSEQADSVKGCVHVPNDDLCGDSSGFCTSSICTPALGCQVVVHGSFCELNDQHCDVETGECVDIARTCAEGCDDGNDCNGREICNAEDVCIKNPAQPECAPPSDVECREAFCELVDGEYGCEIRLLPACYDVALPSF